jgi:hypothetical protein
MTLLHGAGAALAADGTSGCGGGYDTPDSSGGRPVGRGGAGDRAHIGRGLVPDCSLNVCPHVWVLIVMWALIVWALVVLVLIVWVLIAWVLMVCPYVWVLIVWVHPYCAGALSVHCLLTWSWMIPGLGWRRARAHAVRGAHGARGQRGGHACVAGGGRD